MDGDNVVAQSLLCISSVLLRGVGGGCLLRAREDETGTEHH